MYTCKETVRMLSSEEKLTFKQKIELRAHLFICKHCSAYSKQLIAIKDKLKQNFEIITQQTEPDHIKKLENQIVEKLKMRG